MDKIKNDDKKQKTSKLMATNSSKEQQHVKSVHQKIKSIEMSSQIQNNDENHSSSKQVATNAPEEQKHAKIVHENIKTIK